MCLVGAVVAFWSLIQEGAGLSPINDLFLLLNSLNSVNTFRKNSNMTLISKFRIQSNM